MKRSGGIVVGGLSSLHDDVVLEILLRLPHKSVVRFKSVSKNWCSIIRSPSFIKFYLRYNPVGLLISMAEYTEDIDLPLGRQVLRVQPCFYYSPLQQPQLDCGKPFDCFLKFPSTSLKLYMDATKVVNGIACVFEHQRVFVCNVCTGEIMRLPDPKTCCDDNNSYHFGYDPVNDLYKLLKIDNVISGQDGMAATPAAYRYSILTLGRDSSWRKLALKYFRANNEPMMFDAESLLMKGTLYWINKMPNQNAGMISFDLDQEKFQFVKPPLEVNHSYLLNSSRLKLAQFRGRIAMLCTTGNPDCHIVVHMLEDNEGRLWSRHVIPFPSDHEFEGFASIGTSTVGNLPTGQLLLADNIRKFLPIYSNNSRESFLPVYAYDHEKNKLDKFVVGKPPESRHTSVSLSFLVESNIVALGDLFSQGGATAIQYERPRTTPTFPRKPYPLDSLKTLN
ncbi:hypothetical protein ACH5RR_040859 [Cinchona calisaya]|uniref:F-box domain-containing protein n=1 Tax=Cinchona calisaya TaxID=153742 RepID=A0ABD2XUY5_9GENT